MKVSIIGGGGRVGLVGGHEEQQVGEAQIGEQPPGRDQPLEVIDLRRVEPGVHPGELGEAGHGSSLPARRANGRRCHLVTSRATGWLQYHPDDVPPTAAAPPDPETRPPI